MPYRLPDEGRATALRAARVMFPHDKLPDAAYDKVVSKLEADAAADSGIAATLEQGVAELDANGRFVELDDDAQLSALGDSEGSAFFDLLKATSVVELYDNPLVWKAFGYEGPSTHLGGYVDRGFDDLDWLPDPPAALDPTAGSHHR
jgi:hypothetical protein